jgi:hypothetical protein
MPEHQELFDVVMFGSLLQGAALGNAANKLAQLLEIDSATAEKLLREPAAEVRQGLPIEAAREWQKLLLGMGIQCNYRPTVHSDVQMELADESAFPHSLTCPACGHEHYVEARQPEPQLCVRCGVVFRKFGEVRRKKLERESLKRKLTEQHRRELETEQRSKRLDDAPSERTRLLAQLRHELGLPPFIRSRSWLYLSWTLLFLLGAAAGATGLFLAERQLEPLKQWLGLAPAAPEPSSLLPTPTPTPTPTPAPAPKRGGKAAKTR